MPTVLWTVGRKPPTRASDDELATSSGDDKSPQVLVSEELPLGEPINTSRKFFWQKSEPLDLDAIATQRSVFDDPDLAIQYRPRPDWENIHRFDPSARWTWREEKALIRKIDVRIFIFTCIAFMALEIDRVNLGQALTNNFLKDLNLTTNDYNLGNSVFTLSFMCAELPSQLVSKWMGPDRWIPLQMILWSVVASCQFKLDSRASFLVTRALLGILQGGFIPDMNLYLSYFYTSAELPIRLSRWWAAMTSAIIIGAFMAFGILHLDGRGGVEGWRWLFLIEGLFTAIIGVSAFYFMPPSPTQTRGFPRGKKGWFTEREEIIIINRAIRDDPSKGTMHNRQPITPKLLFKALSDYHLWPLYITAIVFQMPMGPPAQYLTLSLRGLGFTTFQTNLLTIPSSVLSMLTLLGGTMFAGWTNQLALNGLLAQFWALPCLVALYTIDTTTTNKWVVFAIVTVLLGYPSNHSVQVGWASRNANTVRSRTVSTAMYNMCCQAGSVIHSNIYRADDAPRYRRGNRDLIAICVGNVFLYLTVHVYYRWVNYRRDKIWNAWTPEEREHYIKTTKHEGNKRLDFRFDY
ncbi:major facilitator superfamily transporter [Niveomyces insectorum RCEF 264]|uniref:Major facilitator superfamily transporter n=1 Tax=Niveomyces insectorum RCEF 264 TaxID=1081102 RepID=A0A167YNY3_9HYPO|nr:major facilitator superfamily transporter [Niveomyces insectorum RCEF 264]